MVRVGIITGGTKSSEVEGLCAHCYPNTFRDVAEHAVGLREGEIESEAYSVSLGIIRCQEDSAKRPNSPAGEAVSGPLNSIYTI